MIRIENVSKSFYKRDTAVDAVHDMNLTIERREIVAVIGPSGCGKSTLLNMIAGLYAPTRGQVVYKGATVSGVNTDVGYMTQKDNLLPWGTVAKTSRFPSSCRAPKGERSNAPTAGPTCRPQVLRTVSNKTLRGMRNPPVLAGCVSRGPKCLV